MMQVNPTPVRTGYETVQRILERSQRGVNPLPNEEYPSLTSEQAAARLNRGDRRWTDSNRNGKTELTYEIPSVAPDEFSGVKQDNPLIKMEAFVPLTLRQQQLVRAAQQEYADVANVTFTEKTAEGGEGHLIFSAYSAGENPSDNGGFAYYPDPDDPKYQGMIWMRHVDKASKFGPMGRVISEDFWRRNLLHETGHALGLRHPFAEKDENLEIEDYEEDWGHYTIMGYNSPQLGKNGEGVSPVSLMIDDIEAIQAKYGANTATRTGDTTYGFNSNTDRDHYSLKTAEDKPLFSVWDGGGWDTLDFSEFSQNQTINLNAGSFSSVGGLQRNVSIANRVTIEEAIGGKGKNNLIGNNAFNILRGGPKEDILYGGSGGAQMWGGEGANTFVFDTTSSGKPNWVMDFVRGKDKLDMSGISKQLGPLNFVSELALDHSKSQDPSNPTFVTKPGDVLVSYDPDFQRTLFRLDTTGDGKMDMHIDVHGVVTREDIVA